MIHVAITRRVRRGAEEEFESKVHEFFATAHAFSKSSDGYLVRPLSNNEYGILRSFTDEEEKERFYASRLYQDWSLAIEPFVVGAPVKKEVHGLEAFFGPSESAPPRWKMAFLTWIAVNPAVYVFAHLVPMTLGQRPPLVELLLVNAFVVAALTWLLMPLLTRVAKPWLLPKSTA